MKAKSVLLVVHDDSQIVRQLAKMASEIADLVTARDSVRAGAIIESGVLFSAALVGKPADSVSAIDVLGAVRAKRPQARTILLADPADLTASIEALHSGVVDHLINPPLRERELMAILSLPSPRPASTGAATVPPAPARAR